MKCIFNTKFTLIFLCIGTIKATYVKVLLETIAPGQTVHFHSKNGFTLKNPANHHELSLEKDRKDFTCVCTDDGVYVDHKKICNESMLFDPNNHHVAYNKDTYSGMFLIKKWKDGYLLINYVPLEEYVFSVLKTESWPGWPLEMNKVMAIITRTYCLHHMMLSYQKKLPYHIKNSNYHQTYKGVHSCSVSKQAVEETKGLFVAYKQAPILAMFDCCCGGVIPVDIEGVIDFKKAPYLGRTYACSYCKYAKIFNWSMSYTIPEFTDALQEEMPFIVKDIKNVFVSECDKAGLVKKVTIVTKNGSFDITGDQLYKLSPSIKSYLCSISVKKHKKIVIKGKGYGHHIGLCQWGAREMVRLEYSLQDILDFYYPGTVLMRFIEDEQSRRAFTKGKLCQDIKGILSEVQLRSLA